MSLKSRFTDKDCQHPTVTLHQNLTVMMKLYGALYEELNEMAIARAMENIMDPENHMDAVEISRYDFMEGARIAFNLIAMTLMSKEGINDIDTSLFEDGEEELTEEEIEIVERAKKKLLS